MQNGGDGFPCNTLAGQCRLVKMLITFEQHGVFNIKFCILIHYNIIERHVCKTVIRQRLGVMRQFACLVLYPITLPL